MNDISISPRRRQRGDRQEEHAGADPRVPPHVAADPRTIDRVSDHDIPRQRRRQHSSLENQDAFYFPLDQVPEGSSYEWKRYSVHGQHDPFYLAKMRQQGWEPVIASKHPDVVPPGYAEQYIVKDGMILMERPAELTEEARSEMRTMARQQVREAEQRLGLTPKDTMTRDHAGARPQIVKELGRMIPIEE